MALIFAGIVSCADDLKAIIVRIARIVIKAMSRNNLFLITRE